MYFSLLDLKFLIGVNWAMSVNKIIKNDMSHIKCLVEDL